MIENRHGMPYRAKPPSTGHVEPPSTGHTKPDRRPADPVRAYFSKNPLNRIETDGSARFGAIPSKFEWYGSVRHGSMSNRTVSTAHRGWGGVDVVVGPGLSIISSRASFS